MRPRRVFSLQILYLRVRFRDLAVYWVRAQSMPSKKSARKQREEKTEYMYCYIERVDDMVLLRRKLPSGRIISIDTCDSDMLNGGVGIAHLNMNNGDNRIENLKWVKEAEARKLLMEFEEGDRVGN